VVRLLLSGQGGTHHQLTEFTKDDISGLVARGPSLRYPENAPGSKPAAKS